MVLAAPACYTCATVNTHDVAINRMNAPVSALLGYNHTRRQVTLPWILFDGREYVTNRITYHHLERVGRGIVHTFHVEADGVYFRLALDAETLHWTLLESRFYAPTLQSKALHGDAH